VDGIQLACGGIQVLVLVNTAIVFGFYNRWT